jgi:predicted  nucleic acid-binding Zn-ribbon protein
MKSVLKSAKSLVLLLLLPVLAVCAYAQEAGQGSLEDELQAVKQEVASLYQQVNELSKDLVDVQHDAEYNDPAVAELYREIRMMEAELVEKRKELQARLSLVPEVQELEKQRKALFERIQELREQERLILNEIKLEEGGDLTGE